MDAANWSEKDRYEIKNEIICAGFDNHFAGRRGESIFCERDGDPAD